MAVEETEGSRVRISPSPFAEVTKGKKLVLKTSEETEAYQTYLENRILNKNELNIQIRISRHPRPYKRLYGRNKLVNAKAFMKT